MPVVTMMWIGGQRSLTAAASFSPSIEPGKSISVKMVRMSLGVSRTLIASSAFATAITSYPSSFSASLMSKLSMRSVFYDKNGCQNALLLTTKPVLNEFVPDRTKIRRELTRL
jgi:hypothetical protein